MSTSNKELQSWVKDISKMTKPENIYWCNGSKEE
jgi:GTP-dependent phosphoenolpyruvate carboxykinase